MVNRIYWNWLEDSSVSAELKDVLAAAKKRAARGRTERIVVIRWQDDEIEVSADSDTDKMVETWIKKFQDRQKQYQLSAKFIKAQQKDCNKRRAAIHKLMETAGALSADDHTAWFDLIENFHRHGDRIGLDLAQECRQMTDIMIKKGFSAGEFNDNDYTARCAYNAVSTARFIITRLGLASFEKGEVPRGVPEKMVDRYRFLLRGESVNLDQRFRW
jgi:hypothetical protein